LIFSEVQAEQISLGKYMSIRTNHILIFTELGERGTDFSCSNILFRRESVLFLQVNKGYIVNYRKKSPPPPIK